MRDTSPEARQVLLGALRRLGPSARLALACELSEELRSLSADGIRHRDPGLSPEQVADLVRSLLLGPGLAQQVRATLAPRP